MGLLADQAKKQPAAFWDIFSAEFDGIKQGTTFPHSSSSPKANLTSNSTLYELDFARPHGFESEELAQIHLTFTGFSGREHKHKESADNAALTDFNVTNNLEQFSRSAALFQSHDSLLSISLQVGVAFVALKGTQTPTPTLTLSLPSRNPIFVSCPLTPDIRRTFCGKPSRRSQTWPKR